ncbi:MAG: sporulation protein YunB, partial [Anaerosolibacter sp.]
MVNRNKYQRRRSNFKGFMALVLLLLFIIYSFLFVDQKIKPAVLAIAQVKAREIATRAINEAVNDRVSGDIKYQDLIFIRTDDDGNVTMMQAN